MTTELKSTFGFTSEQTDKLNEWKRWLDDPGIMEWTSNSRNVVNSIRVMLNKTGFREGNDLTPEELCPMFQQMGEIVHNQRRNRDLFEKNGLVRFNTRLRNLYYGYEPIVKRMDDFCELCGVGQETLSQFLCVFDPTLYPISTDKTLAILDLSKEQKSAALKQSLQQHHITSEGEYNSHTVKYLQSAIIYEEIKNITGVETYYHVNAFIWRAGKQKQSCQID